MELMKKTLTDGLPALGIALEEPAIDALCAFGAAVVKQNEVMNLTGITESSQVAKLHLLDSLSILAVKDLKGKKWAKPELKAAYAEEGCYVGADQLDVLCAIKSKNEVIAEIVALLQSPAKNVVSALQSGANTIHGVLKTLGEKPE